MPEKIFDHALSWTPAEQIEAKALEQVRKLSEMPFIFKHIAVMPDCHYGRGATVGTCIPTSGAIIPAAVGTDIGCGMMAVRTSLTKADMPQNLSAIRLAIEAAVPLSSGNYNENLSSTTELSVEALTSLADTTGSLKFYDQTSHNWRLQLGTLGSGNHFIEIVLDEQDQVWAFLHTGSRGIGNRVANHHIKVAQRAAQRWFINLPDPDLAYLPLGTQEFKSYFTDLQWLQQFAYHNRKEIMNRTLSALAKTVGEFVTLENIDCHHNFSQWEHHMKENIIVSRKGAIQAREGQLGLIPGSMGTRSYVVRGKGNVPSFHTAPHGAGRRMSRGEAFKTFTMDDYDAQMQGVEANRSSGMLDELPAAYKDIDLVMEQSHDLVEIVHTFRQIVNVKGEDTQPWRDNATAACPSG